MPDERFHTCPDGTHIWPDSEGVYPECPNIPKDRLHPTLVGFELPGIFGSFDGDRPKVGPFKVGPVVPVVPVVPPTVDPKTAIESVAALLGNITPKPISDLTSNLADKVGVDDKGWGSIARTVFPWLLLAIALWLVKKKLSE